MTLKSQWVFECICGATVRSETPTAICQSCGRHLVVEWQTEAKPRPALTPAMSMQKSEVTTPQVPSPPTGAKAV